MVDLLVSLSPHSLPLLAREAKPDCVDDRIVLLVLEHCRNGHARRFSRSGLAECVGLYLCLVRTLCQLR